MEIKKLFIFTEGGGKLGYGHLSRCSAIYEEAENLGYKVEFIVNGDKEVEEFLDNKNLTLVDWRNSLYLKKMLKDNDFAVIDSYLAKDDIYNLISILVKKVIYIDDNKRVDYPKGIVVNPSISCKNLDYPKKIETKYNFGVDYVILRKDFLNVEKKEINSINDIMITFGGSDITNATPKVLELLEEKYSEIRKHVVIAKGFKNIDEIKMRCDKNTILYYNLSAKKMKELMYRCDFAIVAAGQTIYEMIRVHLPFIPIKVVENQENNIRGLIKIGIIEKEIGIDEIIENINIQLERFKNLDGNIIDGKGASRIIELLEGE